MTSLARRIVLRVKLAARPKLPTLWLENEAGERWVPDLTTNEIAEPPPGFIYQWSRFPTQLQETCLRTVQQEEVDACNHPPSELKVDHGIIDTMEGRECNLCHGYQSKNKGEPWPTKWEAHGSREVMVGNSSWPDDLVLAMVRPSPEEIAKAIERFGEEPRLLGMSDAIVMAAISCEKCLNALLWRYGLDDGYSPFSEQWNASGTECSICKTPGVWDWLLNEARAKKVAQKWLMPGNGPTDILQCPTEPVYDDGCDCYKCPQTGEQGQNGPVGDGPTLVAKMSPQQRGWERRKEKDDFTEQNIPSEHLLLWRKLKNQFKGTPDERAEQFMEYVEAHPEENDAWLQEHADKEVAKATREWERKQREQARLEKDCDKNQTLYENAWYKEQERATKEKNRLKKLKEKADNVCETLEDFADTVPFAASMVQRVAARYKSKKKVKKQDGGDMVVYEYSDRQIANRNRKKAEQIAKLEKAMGTIRKKVQKDLKSGDPETVLTALVVGLMDHTYERVGNTGSAKEGHYGVTGWLKKHVTLGKGKVTIQYIGKSGVEQEKYVTDPALVKALRKAYDDAKADGDCLFCYDGGTVDASKVNAYLEPFGVTAKDIRGLHANREMRERLTAERKGKLPDDPKKREKQLKDEFKKALEGTAEAVGHEAATLRSQYLVPGLEEDFLKDGTVAKVGG